MRSLASKLCLYSVTFLDDELSAAIYIHGIYIHEFSQISLQWEGDTPSHTPPPPPPRWSLFSLALAAR